jgi:hypothetical protein
MKKILIILLLFCVNTITNAQNIDTFFAKTDAFFKKNVSNNKVDYQNIKVNTASLNEILEIASKIDISKEDTNTTKAFWINAYNLSVIKGIVSKYPVKSPMDIVGFFDKNTHLIANKKITLNDIEGKMLRAKYNDARLHFVLVCGANGCPPIINNAYLPSTLDEQLNKQTTLAVNNPNFIKVNTASKKVELSQIFEWYKEDFVSKTTKEIDFLNKFRNDKIDTKFKVSYYAYDWTLNKTK